MNGMNYTQYAANKIKCLKDTDNEVFALLRMRVVHKKNDLWKMLFRSTPISSNI